MNRPDNFEQLMDSIHGPGDSETRGYVKSLEARVAELEADSVRLRSVDTACRELMTENELLQREIRELRKFITATN